MKLQHIDKARYRKHLNVVIGGFIASFAALAILFGSLLIAFFSPENEQRIVSTLTNKPTLTSVNTKNVNTQNINTQNINTQNVDVRNVKPNNDQTSKPVEKAEPTSNFRYNLAGVIIALVCCGAGLSKVKRTLYFTEIYYVWQLKQLHNKIYRRLARIKNASESHDVNALIILFYYYTSLLQVYQLDDNTLVSNTVVEKLNTLNDTLSSLQLNIDESDFNADLLAQF